MNRNEHGEPWGATTTQPALPVEPGDRFVELTGKYERLRRHYRKAMDALMRFEQQGDASEQRIRELEAQVAALKELLARREAELARANDPTQDGERNAADPPLFPCLMPIPKPEGEPALPLEEA